MTALITSALLAAAMAGWAPALPTGPAQTPLEAVQFRGGNWRDHPLMYRGNWEAHNRQWDAIEGRSTAATTTCARFRTYDPVSRTYIARNGRRVRCR